MKKNINEILTTKKQKYLVLLTVVLLLVAVGLFSYAFTGDINYIGLNTNKISNCTIDLSFKDSNPVRLTAAYPMDYETAKEYDPYTFYIKSNNSNCEDLKYKISMSSICNSCTTNSCDLGDGNTCNCTSGYQIDESLINYELKNVNTGEIIVGEGINKLSKIYTLSGTETHTYEMRMWIDEEASNNDLYVNGDSTTSKNYCGKLNVRVAVGNNLDMSGANSPVLASNMIPIYYDPTEAVWKKSKADNSGVEGTCKLGDVYEDDKVNNKDFNYLNQIITGEIRAKNSDLICGDINSDGNLSVEDIDIFYDYIARLISTFPAGEPLEEKTYLIPWYDYNQKMWANAVTVTEVNGSRSDLVDAAPGTPIPMDRINSMLVWIPRFNAAGDAENYNSGTADAPGAFNITFVGTDTAAHDAFHFGGAISGFWIGKFENSSDITCTPANNSEVGAGCNITTIRPKILPNATSWRGASVSTFFSNMQNMTESGNQYGFDKTKDTTLDTHMLKNNEWGAVVYLTQSIYGRCSSSTNCSEVGINNNSSYVTGYGAPAGSSSSVTNGTYETTLGMDASTTGNIYGVYDMSGGSYEYVMGNYNNTIGSSQFTTLPNTKYYNVYTTESDYTNAGLQHALTETKNWYGVNSYFVNSNGPWFLRGGYYDNSTSAGVVNFYYNAGYSRTNVGCRLSVTIN